MKKIAILLLALGLPILNWSQTTVIVNKDSVTVAAGNVRVVKETTFRKNKFYLGTSMETFILSTANLTKNDRTKLTTPRFTAWPHFGVTGQIDFAQYFGMFIGANLRNIGFIDKIGDSTIKRRVISLGPSLGLKLGNVEGTYGFIGGGVDFPLHFKEKAYIKRSNKDKTSEWFSERVPSMMPFLFVGAHVRPGIAVKFQYYPGNFLNSSFSEQVGGITVRPYDNMEARIFFLSLGFDIPYFPKYD